MNAAHEFRPMTLRMPTDLYERVRASAAQHDRSAGAEVRMIVRQHLEQQKSAQSAPTEKATP
jgi:plasmid stability protein